MSIAAQKKIGWALLVMSLGGTAALCVISVTIVVNHEPVSSDLAAWSVWPPIGVATGFFLRRCYKIEPMAPLGFWHLNINDLLAASLYIGLLLAGTKSLMPEYFLLVGIPFAIICGIAFVIGLLAAARAGIRKHKFFYAFSCGMRLTGLFAFGAVVAVVIVDGFTYGLPFFWINTLLFANPLEISSAIVWQLLLHRLTLLCLPIGLVCFEIAKRRRTELASGELRWF
jgi:hypothetical protein